MRSPYVLNGKYIWDPWFIKADGQYHVFYLQARRTRDPERRHYARISIGHAVSTDLVNWQRLPNALDPGAEGTWDDRALWTGSLIGKDGTYYLYYTGRQRGRGRTWIQKIGLATSTDLLHWEKHPQNPLTEAIGPHYAMSNAKNRLGRVAAWRDPHVFFDPASQKYYKVVSARALNGKNEYNACIGLAESDDLVHWTPRAPLLFPGHYDEMEVPQMVVHDGKYYLFFSNYWDSNYEPGWARQNGAHTGLHCYWAPKLDGEYKPVNGNGVVMDNANRVYNVRLIERKGNAYTGIGALTYDERGAFVGGMSKPFSVVIEGERVYAKA